MWSVSSQPSGARSLHMDSRSSKPGIALAARVLSGPAETRLHADARRGRGRGPGSASVDSSAGLGHAHPVVRRPRDGRVEGHARRPTPPDDISGRQATASDFREYAETCTACATSGHGPVEELAAQQRLGVAVGDGVHDAVEPVDVLAHQVGQPGEVLVVGDVELEHRRLGRQPLGDPLGDAQRPAEVRDQHGRALLLRDPRHGEADGGVHRHAGDQDPLAVENCPCQCPIPSPPSTGMTAPVM